MIDTRHGNATLVCISENADGQTEVILLLEEEQ